MLPLGLTEPPQTAPRRASPDDAAEIARLLHDFNTEFGEPSPGPDVLAGRLRELLAAAEVTVLLTGEPPAGLALLRVRPGVFNEASAYLEELYVVPERRGHGIGRALLDAGMDLARARGCDHIELGTAETDTAARALYESAGFTNREGSRDGPRMLYYEREI